MRTFSVTSFGFRQKGAQVVGVHPRYFFAQMGEDEYRQYIQKVTTRMANADQAFQRGLYGAQMIRLTEKNIYEDDGMEEALLRRYH